ncbi:MAG: DUF1343 domain-containing protein, partial [Bacteroidales bacterium]
MKTYNLHLILLLILWCTGVSAQARTVTESSVLTGAERLDLLLPLLKDQKVGLIVNQTSVSGKNQTHLLDTLLSCGIAVTTVFAPEHGFRG